MNHDTRIIEIKNLVKQYSASNTKVLDQINMSIKPGIFGLIGENGAGKTTLIKILVTMLKKTSGEIRIGDYTLPDDESEIRKMLGYLPQNFEMFQTMTVYESMNYFAALKNIPISQRKEEILQLLDKVNLLDKKENKIKQLSGGMKQRLGIASCLLGNPKVIVMDEPTVGLDPTERLRFRSLLSSYADGRSIILSSHIISDIAMLCNDVAIMKKGKMLYEGSTKELVKMMNHKVYVVSVNEIDEVAEEDYPNIISISRKENELEVRFFSESVPAGYQSQEAEPSLEDAYFYITSKGS